MLKLLLISSITLIIFNGVNGCTEVKDYAAFKAAIANEPKSALLLVCSVKGCDCGNIIKPKVEAACTKYSAKCFIHDIGDPDKINTFGDISIKNGYPFLALFKSGTEASRVDEPHNCPSSEQIETAFTKIRS